MRSGSQNPWIAVFVVLLGTFPVILDTTIVNLALAEIGESLGESNVDTIVTFYLLAVGLVQLPAGWFADRFGRKAVFVVSVALFGIGSLLAALSPSLPLLAAARVIQGIGGGAVLPTGMAIIYELFPPDRRGKALSVWGVTAMIAPALGPLVGGYLLTVASWPWLFAINVPLALLALVIAQSILEDTSPRHVRRLDTVGLLLVSIGLVLWLTALSGFVGWTPEVVLSLLVGVFLMTVFVLWEIRVEHPLVDLLMFRAPSLSLSMVIAALVSVVQYGILVFVPLQLTYIGELSAFQVGASVVPMAIGSAVTFPLGGYLTDRSGPKVPVSIGAVLLASASLVLTTLDSADAATTSAIGNGLLGLGLGFAVMPVSVNILNAVSQRFVSQAAAVRQLATRVSAAFGIAVLASITLLSGRSGDLDASDRTFRSVFVALSIIAVVVFLLALFLPGSAANRQLQRAKSAEYRTP